MPTKVYWVRVVSNGALRGDWSRFLWNVHYHTLCVLYCLTQWVDLGYVGVYCMQLMANVLW